MTAPTFCLRHITRALQYWFWFPLLVLGAVALPVLSMSSGIRQRCYA